MGILNSFDKWVSKHNWDYLKFLQIITLTIIVNVLLFIVWMMLLVNSGFIDFEVFQDSMILIGKALLFGAILGLLIGFFELLPKYLQKQWDLHIVTPYFLVFHLISLFIVTIILIALDRSTLQINGVIIGYVLGGLLAIIAYMGEVRREHQDEVILIEE